MNKFLGLFFSVVGLSSVQAQAGTLKFPSMPKMPSGLGGLVGGKAPGTDPAADRGRVIAHCHFTVDKDNRYESVDIRIFKNSPVGGVAALRTGEAIVKDRIGQVVEELSFDYVYSQRVRKESAGPYGEALTAAQLLGITQADSIMLYGLKADFNRPIGLAVVHDVDDDPIDSFAMWGKQAIRCDLTDRD